MKFNWGYGIAISIILFIVFILVMVFKISKLNTELYSVDYYDQEIKYQNRIDAVNNVHKLKSNLNITQYKTKFKIEFPIEFKQKKINGDIYFYRPDDKSLDKKIKINTSNNFQFISKEYFKNGLYKVGVLADVNNKSYYFDMNIRVK